MQIFETPLAGLNVVQSVPHLDARGSFVRLFCTEELNPLVGSRRVVQINQSITSGVGALRGMHFQHPPHAEMKLIRCLRGRVWDVAVDLRAASPTFLHWHAEELAGGDARMVVIPEGFAHGFQTLEPETELLYLHTAAYHQPAEGGLRHDDPRLAITWPLPPHDLSTRDLSHPLLDAEFTGITP